MTELARLSDTERRGIIARHIEAGVNILLPDTVIIGADVKIEADTTILPGCILEGKTTVGKHCEIGPDTRIVDSAIGEGCVVQSSFIENSTVRDKSRLGPWCHIRPGSDIGKAAKLGNFVEVKNSNIGAHTSVSHLTYIGDSDVGKNCNLGCGVVTANYDGKNKHRTTVGDSCFIGCNSNFVPPVTLGDRVYCATGTTITGDVPAGALVIGRVRQEIKEGWSDRKGLFKK
ncbi:MAG: UDP-N-acetylglucosamine diphosphorylase [Oscillospiraceae bacterium]|nr:UDP-N-acetylglucosamine diphosphorylase [Oscillospiraceae bacterium]